MTTYDVVLVDDVGNVMITATVPALAGDPPGVIFWGTQAFVLYAYARPPLVYRRAHCYSLPDDFLPQARPAGSENMP